LEWHDASASCLGGAGRKSVIREAYPMMDRGAASEGWDEPAIDVYNEYESPTEEFQIDESLKTALRLN
jgi:hypothetical protein